MIQNDNVSTLHEADRQLGRLLSTLRQLGRLEKAIIVVYGDNGEVFHENGQGVPHAEHPGETRNLIEQNPDEARTLRANLARWRSRQLAYYHFPRYYQRYYPPPATSDE